MNIFDDKSDKFIFDFENARHLTFLEIYPRPDFLMFLFWTENSF